MDQQFLFTMLDEMSVSGHEIPLQKKVIAHMQPYCDQVLTDMTGNVICALNPEAEFKVMLAGHVDEIGLVVTQIQDDGLVRVAESGGIEPSTYPGHQVVIHGYAKKVYGVVIHSEEVDKAELKASELHIDIGAKDRAEAKKWIREGDPVHLNTYHQLMENGRLSARAVDDRAGVFIVMEALKRARELGCRIGVYSASTVGEETNSRGAYWAGSRIRPDMAIVVDVTYAQDYPGAKPQETGFVELGKGPVICNGALSHRKVNDLLMACAEKAGIPYQMEAAAGKTYTDADILHFTGQGVVTALVSLPLRYMHTPGEMCALSDVENTIELLAQFLCAINADTDLDPFH